MIQVLLWLPLAAALLACLAPRRAAPWVATAGALGTLVLAVLLVFDFDSGVAGIQHAVDEAWIPDLAFAIRSASAASACSWWRSPRCCSSPASR